MIEAHAPDVVDLLRRHRPLVDATGFVHPQGRVERPAAEVPLVITGHMRTEVACRLHAAILQEIGNSGVEGIGQVHEKAAGREQRVHWTVREAKTPHPGAQGTAHHFVVGTLGPVCHPHFLKGTGRGVVVGPVDIGWLAVAVPVRGQPQPASVPLGCQRLQLAHLSGEGGHVVGGLDLHTDTLSPDAQTARVVGQFGGGVAAEDEKHGLTSGGDIGLEDQVGEPVWTATDPAIDLAANLARPTAVEPGDTQLAFRCGHPFCGHRHEEVQRLGLPRLANGLAKPHGLAQLPTVGPSGPGLG